MTEDQKTQLYVEFLNAIQRVKCSSHVSSAYPYNNTLANQPNLNHSYYPGFHYTSNNYPQSCPYSKTNTSKNI